MLFRKLRLRIARRRELIKLERLLRNVGRRLSQEEIIDYIRKRQVIVLEKKRRPIGVLIYALIGIAGMFSLLHIRRLVVGKKWRGRGHGSFLLERAKRLAARRKAQGIFLHALSRARGFYARHGLSSLGSIFWWWRK